MQPQSWNIFKDDSKLSYSFGDNKEEKTEEWDLPDELLWENVQANIPISIKNLNENMQKVAWRTKRSTHSFDNKIKSNKGWSFIRPSLEFDWEMKNLIKFKSATMKKSSIFEPHNYNTKRSIKDDISYLLRWLIDEKKKNIVISEQIKDDKNDQEIFVTMKEIAEVKNE